MFSPRKLFALTAGLALVAGCGGGGGDAPPVPGAPPAASACSIASEKQFVDQVARDWYLFLDLLPATLDPAPFGTADDFLDALTATARSQGRDRFFSFLTTISAEQQFFAAGQSVGFGISTVTNAANTQLFVTQVFEQSAAFDAGFRRGDEILAIGASVATLQDIATILAQPTGLADALGPTQAGVTRSFRVRTVAGATVDRTATKRDFSLNPVPTSTLIPRQGLTPIGYLNLRTFISPADQALRNAFATFAAQNVRDLIIDLRYNGGGAVATAELLSNLMLAGQANQVLFATRLNSRKASQEETVRVRAETEALPALRVAFLTLGGSASASELVITALAPYAEVAVIGGRSFGKPVGQFAFDLGSGCDTRLRLVTFKTVNRNNYGDYFGGLPDTAAQVPDASCAIPDDLTRAQGDPAENLTSEAIHWINNGVCRTGTPPIAFAKPRPDEPEPIYPLAPRRPAPFQVVQPGAF
jgi:C-terminal processing protease CtpA/Prc